MKKICITGSSGFLGSHAVTYALNHGYEVNGLSITPPDRPATEGPFKLYRGTIEYGQDVQDAIYGCEYVLHFAAFSSMAGFQDDLEANYYTNVAGFLNVLDVAHHAKVAKLVYASSSAIYFDGKYSQLAQKLGEAFTEEDPFINPLRLHTHYGKSKLINEMIAASYDSAYNFSTLGLRYFNVYGAGDEKKTNRCAPVQHFINSRKEGKPIVIYGDGSQAKDFIYVDDAIDITFRLLESNADGVCNVGTGVATSFNDAADTVDELFQSKSEHRYVPIPNPDSYQYYTRADVSKMLSFVGEHKFTTLREGLGHLV